MNALSFISRSRSASRSASQASRTRDRTPSLSTQTTAYGSDESTSQDLSSITGSIDSEEPDQDSKTDDESSTHERDMAFADESTPLLDTFTPTTLSNLTPTKSSSWRNIPSRISNGFVGAVKVIVRVIVSPFAYVIACFYDETGGFSPLLPFFTIARVARPKKRRRISNGAYGREKADQLLGDAARPPTRRKRGGSIEAAAVVDTDSLSEKMDDTPVSRHTRSRSSISSTSTEEQPSSNRRSIRIKLNNDPSKPRRKRLEAEAATSESAHDMLAASLKSPPSSTHAAHKASLMKYPKAPLPPRPLVPRRQPSYTKIPASLALLGPSAGPHKKTLILDLDETLIHSHSKGGRFTTGHMVEVRLQHSLGHGGVMIGPQVPILYYVHKRPYCDEFLRKVRLKQKKTPRNRGKNRECPPSLPSPSTPTNSPSSSFCRSQNGTTS